MVFQNDKDKIWQIIGLEGFKSPIEGTNKRMGFLRTLHRFFSFQYACSSNGPESIIGWRTLTTITATA